MVIEVERECATHGVDLMESSDGDVDDVADTLLHLDHWDAQSAHGGDVLGRDPYDPGK